MGCLSARYPALIIYPWTAQLLNMYRSAKHVSAGILTMKIRLSTCHYCNCPQIKIHAFTAWSEQKWQPSVTWNANKWDKWDHESGPTLAYDSGYYTVRCHNIQFPHMAHSFEWLMGDIIWKYKCKKTDFFQVTFDRQWYFSKCYCWFEAYLVHFVFSKKKEKRWQNKFTEEIFCVCVFHFTSKPHSNLERPSSLVWNNLSLLHPCMLKDQLSICCIFYPAYFLLEISAAGSCVLVELTAVALWCIHEPWE